MKLPDVWRFSNFKNVLGLIFTTGVLIIGDFGYFKSFDAKGYFFFIYVKISRDIWSNIGFRGAEQSKPI